MDRWIIWHVWACHPLEYPINLTSVCMYIFLIGNYPIPYDTMPKHCLVFTPVLSLPGIWVIWRSHTQIEGPQGHQSSQLHLQFIGIPKVHRQSKPATKKYERRHGDMGWGHADAWSSEAYHRSIFLDALLINILFLLSINHFSSSHPTGLPRQTSIDSGTKPALVFTGVCVFS